MRLVEVFAVSYFWWRSIDRASVDAVVSGHVHDWLAGHWSVARLALLADCSAARVSWRSDPINGQALDEDELLSVR